METRLITQLGLPGPARGFIQQYLRRVHPLAILIKQLEFERSDDTEEWLVSGDSVRFISLTSPRCRPYYVNLQRDKHIYPFTLGGYCLSFCAKADGELESFYDE